MSYPRVCQAQGLCNDLSLAWNERVPSILYFSSPDITYSGVAIADNFRNNAGSIDSFAPTAKAWQPTKAKVRI